MFDSIGGVFAFEPFRSGCPVWRTVPDPNLPEMFGVDWSDVPRADATADGWNNRRGKNARNLLTSGPS